MQRACEGGSSTINNGVDQGPQVTKKMEKEIESDSKMVGMITRLYDAAVKGNVTVLLNLLHEDPLILDQYQLYQGKFGTSPLHIAAKLGHFQFAAVILNRKPELAEELDSNQSTPLHLSSAKGHLDIVKALLNVSPDMCLARDLQERSPLHLTIMNDKFDVLEELLRVVPHAAWELLRGQSILHLCVIYDRRRTLELLVNDPKIGRLLINAKDNDGNTILHLAVTRKRFEVADCLLKNSKISKTVMNTSGSTPLALLEQIKKEENTADQQSVLRSLERQLEDREEDSEPWSDSRRSALMVVASLIATLAFQAAQNPPGGSWQDNQPTGQVGSSVMAIVMPKIYDAYNVLCEVGFAFSLIILLLLMIAPPANAKFQKLVMVLLGIPAFSMSFALELSNYVLTPPGRRSIFGRPIGAGVEVSMCTLLTIFVLIRYYREVWHWAS